MTYAQQLRKISDILTEDNWNQGSYFDFKDKLCMCVHGAGQTIVNPQLQFVIQNYTQSLVKIENFDFDPGCRTPRVMPVEAAKDADLVSKQVNEKLSATIDMDPIISYDVWKERPSYVKNDYENYNKNYGNLNLHFLMGMFGITAQFNDDRGTSLQMLKDKLEECAVWAEQNQEFLENN